jgi:hypothetical protein
MCCGLSSRDLDNRKMKYKFSNLWTANSSHDCAWHDSIIFSISLCLYSFISFRNLYLLLYFLFYAVELHLVSKDVRISRSRNLFCTRNKLLPPPPQKKAIGVTKLSHLFRFFCLNPLLFASCTDTFSKWCKITRGMKRSRSGDTTRKEKVVGLERGPLILVSATEELLDRKVAAPV